jgi:ketosteroid isomerase-like protein
MIARPEDAHPEFVRAFNNDDLQGLLALYEADARLLANPDDIRTGHDGIRPVLQQFLDLRGEIAMSTVSIIEGAGVALLRGRWRLNGTAANGNPVAIEGNSIEVLRRQPDGRWLFAIDQPSST